MAELIFILGGARSGKSTLAEQMAHERGGDDVLFVATAQAFDDEMRERITAHQLSRPSAWRTLEAPLQLAAALRSVPLAGAVVVDCITLLASNILLSLPDDASQAQVNQAVATEIDAFIEVLKSSQSTWIVVSNEVGMGIVPAYRLGRFYRDALGMANQRLARAADRVLLMVAGLPWELKQVNGSLMSHV
ncbi:MAG: bifunctional adenosylcobinamide kinase/adenosylcobinamide-phosphate guanylyltransferase [Chloroflexi bacterium]|nr:bifunctional adenosylcobinamide kinase/adenosylcobinamide-phosphate guanylyltransferase [Chloroflexota bacterium]MCL5275902.1 bifunctional adenosylcobinamide kinase/adenosylcobinamide-phosphate guanylyltransferase [Chloroflexota bacterium]